MELPKTTKICDHKSVGMLIWEKNNLLLIERKRFPFGFAPPAGHVDDHGSFEKAARDEVNEETGLTVISLKQISEGKKSNPCRRINGSWHYWKIYEVEAEGVLKPSKDEAKQIGWFDKEEINYLAEKTKKYLKKEISEEEWEKSPGLEPVWYKTFKKLNVL